MSTENHTTTHFTRSGSLSATGAHVSNNRYADFARVALQVALLSHVLFAVLFLVMRILPMVWVNLVSISIYAVCLDLQHRRRNTWVYALVIAELLGHAFVATTLLGGNTGFQFYAWALIPLAATNTRNSLRFRALLVTMIALACLLMEFVARNAPAYVPLPTDITNWIHTFNTASYLAIMATLSFVYAATVASAEYRLHRHANTDALTGLRNRRRTLELARAELARARRSQMPVSVIVTDIDRFKSINDHYGHPFGDQVIVRTAACLRECVREEDHVARWGGEEFLVVLPGIDLEGARAAAERMRIAVRDLEFQPDYPDLQVSASFGIAEWRSLYGETFEQTLARADAALYVAKQSGRNQCSVSPSPALPEQQVFEVLDPSNSMRTQALTVEAFIKARQLQDDATERNAS